METITFEIKSFMKFQLEMVQYPELDSDKKWIKKGIDLLKKHAPRVLQYLSKQKVMAQLKDMHILFVMKPKRRKKQGLFAGQRRNFTAHERRERRTKMIFKVWVQKEKYKRLLLSILEALVIPATPFLALLPGPNVFFYIPALLLYYHFTAYLGLRKVDVDDLNIKIVWEDGER